MILGRGANGRTQWKNNAGKTLKELQTEEATPELKLSSYSVAVSGKFTA